MKQELEAIRKARGILGKLQGKLLNPSIEAFDSGASELMTAIASLQSLESGLAAGNERRSNLQSALAPELHALRLDLQHARALVEGAGKFYQGWARLVLSQAEEESAVYNASGKPGARPVSAGKVVLHG